MYRMAFMPVMSFFLVYSDNDYDANLYQGSCHYIYSCICRIMSRNYYPQMPRVLVQRRKFQRDNRSVSNQCEGKVYDSS